MNKALILFNWLRKEKDIVLKIYLLATLQGIMYISIPLGIQSIITYIMAGSFSASLILLISATIVVTIFIGFFQLWQMRLNETLYQKIFGNISARLTNFLSKTKIDNQVKSDINKFNEVVALQKGSSKILLDFSFSIISIVFGLLLLPIYSAWFSIFVILLGGAFYFIISYYGKKGVQTSLETSDQKYRLLDYFQSKTNENTTNEFISEADHTLKKYFINRKSHYDVLEKQFLGIIVFKVFFIGILLAFGAYLVQIGELNIGQFVASEIIILLVINSVEKLVGSFNTFYDTITALLKIEKIFHEQPEAEISVNENCLTSLNEIYSKHYSKKIKISLVSFFLTCIIILLMPWTQSVESIGKVTTLNPENRPQTITSRIAGRIEKWFIREGQFVHKNDTIAFISEIKDEYVDPQLIDRSQQIIKSKETTLRSYEEKIDAVNSQIDALNKVLALELQQAKNKIIQAKLKINADSIEMMSSLNNYKVAEEQLRRYEELVTKGIVSKTDFENRKVKVQDAIAKKVSSENKFMNSKNELLNAEIELNSIQQNYQEKLMKTESEKFSALSMLYDGEGALTKLQNQLSNYIMRKGFYYVLAPQDGYITKTYLQGIGEIVKEGSAICNIVPEQNEQSVELYIAPIDLPLIKKGQKVQIQFDGWPAFVFSGWPGISYGTYSAEIVAFDRVISENGKFRVLAKNTGNPWPEAIQIGGGVKGFALLNNVPVIYELWRKINGFPPEFYGSNEISSKEKTTK